MNKTKIPWVLNPDRTPGYTWNPITGCLNNCSYCFARKLANTRLKDRYLANDNLAGGYRLARGVLKEDAIPPKLDPFYPRFWEDKIQELVRIRRGGKIKPKGIFACDMSDLFGIGIPKEWTDRVLEIVRGNWQDRFYLLTKQPQNLQKFSPFPENCWVGVSATSLYNFDMATNAFRQIEAKVKYLSVEPLLYEPIWTITNDLHLIDWVIIGALTGTKADLLPLHHKTGLIMVRLNGNRWSLQPQIEWVKEIIEASDKAGIPVFLKDNLRQMWGYTKDIKIRQEIPK